MYEKYCRVQVGIIIIMLPNFVLKFKFDIFDNIRLDTICTFFNGAKKCIRNSTIFQIDQKVAANAARFLPLSLNGAPGDR